MNPTSSLSVGQRAAALARIADGPQLDVLVIGGGITGVGVALDAASRGMRVALLERHDLAHGTSRWSSKLIHGGLRYLRHGQVGVAWESARERHTLISTTAPHLVRAMPFLAVLDHGLSPTGGVLAELGVRAGDAMRMAAGTPGALLPSPRRIGPAESLRLVPALRRDGLRGAILFWDGQLEDDARLVIAVARTAVAHGADIVTRCAVESVDAGTVHARDTHGGRQFTVRARTVVNATGVWAGELDRSVHLRPSKGAHLILEAASLGDPRAAVIVPVRGEAARWVGATPTSDGRIIVGLTDDEHRGPIEDEPAVTAEEERFLLSTVATAFERPVPPSAVVGRYAGFRPLLDSGGRSTADISRRHAIITSRDGTLITLVGGKLTTYRRMAQDLVDRIAGDAGPRCRTATLPLVGAATREQLRGIDAAPRLLARYGAEAAEVAALADGDPSLLHTIIPGAPVLGVELLFGLLHEGAMDIDDLLDRRVRLGLVPAERRAAEPFAARLLTTVAA